MHAVYVVFAAEAGDQTALVFVGDRCVHTACNEYPDYYISPESAVTEALARIAC